MSSVFGDITQRVQVARKDPHEAEAKVALQRLRKSFDELFRLRALNEAAMRGQDKSCKYSPQEMRERVQIYRDPEMERRFQREMYQLLRTLYRRDPTQMEIQAGPPSGEGLGFLPALLGVAAVVGGSAWGLDSITTFLADREARARGEELHSVRRARQFERVAKGAIAVTVIGGSIFGAFKLWSWGKSRKAAKALPAVEAPPALPPASTGEDEEE